MSYRATRISLKKDTDSQLASADSSASFIPMNSLITWKDPWGNINNGKAVAFSEGGTIEVVTVDGHQRFCIKSEEILSIQMPWHVIGKTDIPLLRKYLVDHGYTMSVPTWEVIVSELHEAQMPLLCEMAKKRDLQGLLAGLMPLAEEKAFPGLEAILQQIESTKDFMTIDDWSGISEILARHVGDHPVVHLAHKQSSDILVELRRLISQHRSTPHHPQSHFLLTGQKKKDDEVVNDLTPFIPFIPHTLAVLGALVVMLILGMMVSSSHEEKNTVIHQKKFEAFQESTNPSFVEPSTRPMPPKASDSPSPLVPLVEKPVAKTVESQKDRRTIVDDQMSQQISSASKTILKIASVALYLMMAFFLMAFPYQLANGQIHAAFCSAALFGASGLIKLLLSSLS